MRLLTVPFFSSAEFLSHYSGKHPDGAIFCRTRTDLEVGEAILVEVSFTGLPNRALLRASVLSLEAGRGAWLALDPADVSTRDFLLRLARGELEVTEKMERNYDRFPTSLPVAIKVTSPATTNEVSQSQTTDLSASGVFIRSATPPPVGARVQLVIDAPGPTGAFSLEGEVTWVRNSPTEQGFGVHFRDKRGEDNRRLRALLRRASESGRVRFAV
ncbi:MAG TPA: PilZ domain-containing protein [Kofleriaceae bacterium]|nr:PilZ domain-containing protein [Kofleriaceae bacterium]